MAEMPEKLKQLLAEMIAAAVLRNGGEPCEYLRREKLRKLAELRHM